MFLYSYHGQASSKEKVVLTDLCFMILHWLKKNYSCLMDKYLLKELQRLLFLKLRRGWLPSCWKKEEEADYYCKTKKRQNVICTAIVISEDNKIDYHGQSVALVGGLCYIELIYYYWITGYDYTRSDKLLRLVNC